ncbi:hypothetical protein [Persicobacter sp. CCB-QB2]|uniref:hypothetical protein n=1 Tax=Persicobacter sp. CCB-QB2 TaxID=1561025 RepID=UPI00155DC4AF|nr:hypothetical protein [Persicobacter sp. CCB-QB2]
MGASYLCGQAGILMFTIDNSAAYIRNWKSRILKKMREDNRWITTTTAKAQKAADFILKKGEYQAFNPENRPEKASPEKPESVPKPSSAPKSAQKPKVPAAAKGSPKKAVSTIETEVVRNEKIKRIQLKFSRKPSEIDRAILKSNGFTWAPKQKVWQIPLSATNEEKVHLALGQMSCILKKKSELKTKTKPATPAKKSQVKSKKGASSSKVKVHTIDLWKIQTDEKRFQNRNNAYSEESVKRIESAHFNQKFDWSAFDPIVVWEDPNKKNRYFVLSGHSRFEAFKRISKIDHYFKRIPAKIFGGSERQAIDFALNSNTLSTKETDLERAGYYRKKREECGLSGPSCAKQIEEEIHEKEGKNASTIHNLSYLNPKGWMVGQLLQFDGKDKTSLNNLSTIANWTGEARRRFPKLTHQNENQIAKWLFQQGYGNKSGQFSAKSKFFQYLERFANMGKFDAVINLNRQLSKSPSEAAWEEQKISIEKELKVAEKEYHEKSTRFYAAVNSSDTTRKISKNKADELAKPYLDKVGTIKRKLAMHMEKKSAAKQAGKKQTSLFGTKKKAS